MNIHPIRTKNDYKTALRELSAYFDNEPEPGTEDGDRFEVLATLVEAYEAKHFLDRRPRSAGLKSGGLAPCQSFRSCDVGPRAMNCRR